MKITKAMLAAGGIAALLSGCGKGSSSGGAAAPKPAPPAPETTTAVTTATTTASATDTDTDGDDDDDDEDDDENEAPASASVTLGVKAIATQGGFLTQLTEENAGIQATGSLILSIGLTDQRPAPRNYVERGLGLADASSYRVPVNRGYSIASGAPDEMIVYIKRIELSTDLETEGGEGEGDGDGGPASLKDDHVELFDAQYADAVGSLVDVVYDSTNELLEALVDATGLSLDEVRAIIGDAYQAGELAADEQGDGDEADAPSGLLFAHDEGLPVRINNGTVDLSGLFEELGADSFDVAPDVYRSVKVTFASRAKVRGCVAMHYECRGGAHCATNAPTADIPGNLGVTSGEATELLYCTSAAHSPYSETATQNSNFLNLAKPELMDFPLGRTGEDWPNGGDLSMSFPIPGELPLAEGDGVGLTLAVDLNRMLRYYNRGRTDQGPGPEAPTDRAYFFTSVFEDSIYVFAGETGRVYSYEALASVCGAGEAYTAATDTCATTAAANREKVGFAITIITSPAGMPLVFAMQPDDDNDLTITKGTIGEHQRCPFDSDPAWARASDSGEGKVDVLWALCDNQSEGQPGPYGRMIGFPGLLDDTAVAGPGVAFNAADTTGKFSVLLRSVLRRSAEDPAVERAGSILIRRRL